MQKYVTHVDSKVKREDMSTMLILCKIWRYVTHVDSK